MGRLLVALRLSGRDPPVPGCTPGGTSKPRISSKNLLTVSRKVVTFSFPLQSISNKPPLETISSGGARDGFDTSDYFDSPASRRDS
jgi:hypothetical protein